MLCSLNFWMRLIAVSIGKRWSPAAGETGCACNSIVSTHTRIAVVLYVPQLLGLVVVVVLQPIAFVVVFDVAFQLLRLSGAPQFLTSVLQDPWSYGVSLSLADEALSVCQWNQQSTPTTP